MSPDRPRDPARARDSNELPDRLHRKIQTVLVVEDEGSVRLLVGGVLRAAGLNILSALDGPNALEICRNHPDRIHLMITDFRMPGMDGGELTRIASRLRPDMKILCITATPESVTGIPTAAVLSKPFTLDDILQRVHGLLEGS